MLLALLLALSVGEIPVTSSSREAVEIFREGRDKALNFQLQPASERLRKALALDHDFPQALAWMGKITPGPEGLALLERAGALAQRLPLVERKSVEVLVAERRGEDERVRLLKRELADLAPGDWLAQFQLGVQSFYDHKSQATLLYMTRALALNPRAADAYNYRGYVLATLGQFDDGLRDLRKFVELEPSEPNAYDSYGEVLLLAGQTEEAEKNFIRSTELGPDNWMAWIGVGYARYFRGDYERGNEAIAAARKYVTRVPDQLAVELLLAWGALGRGDARTALSALDALEKRMPGNAAWIAFERAEMLTELARFGEAQGQLGLARERSAGKLAGAEENKLRRSALLLEARIAAAQGQPDAADRALAQLQAELRAAPSNLDLRSVVHYAQGLDALARKEPRKAEQELLLCSRTDYHCRRDLLSAQIRAGDAAAAEETRARLLAANSRDDIHRGEDPVYLYIVTRMRNESRVASLGK